MSLKGLDAPSTLGAGVGVSSSGDDELPHLDRAIQTTRHKISSVGRERNRVYGVLVAIGTLETLDKVAAGGIPHTDALIEGSCGDILGVGGDGNRGDAVLDAEGQNVLASLDIPEANGAITAARCNGATIASEVKRVDILLVTSEAISDGSGGDIPNLGTISIIP